MLPGSYSARFKSVEKQHVEKLREEHADERSDILARSRILSAETSRRRKALAIKRKAEANREENRRQAILSKRREQIREATEKYQRGNRQYIPQNYEDKYVPGYGQTMPPSLEEALAAVRGPPPAQRASSATSRPRIGSASSIRSNGSVSGNVRTTTGQYQQYRMSPHQRSQSASQATSLHERSLRNMNSSRSLFEQQLEQHQQLLLNQQQHSLHQFNEAIHKEIEQDPMVSGVEELHAGPRRADSPDSVDSLDRPLTPSSPVVTRQLINSIKSDGKENQPLMTNGTGNQLFVSNVPGVQASTMNGSASQLSRPFTSTGPNTSSGFILHNSRSSQSPIAVVQPQVQQESSYAEPKEVNNINNNKAYQNLFAQNSKVSSGATQVFENMSDIGGDSVISAKNNGHYNGQHYQDPVVNFVNDMDNRSQVLPQTNGQYYESGLKSENAPLQETHSVTKAKAWATPSPVIEVDSNHKFQHVTRTSSVTYNDREPSVHNVGLTPPASNGYDNNTQPIPPPAMPRPSVPQATPVYSSAKMEPAKVQSIPASAVVSQGSFAVVHSAVPSHSVYAHTGARPVLNTNIHSPITQKLENKQPVTNHATSRDDRHNGEASVQPTAAAMEMLKHYSQFPMYKAVDPAEVDDKNSIQSESSTVVSGSDVAEESQPISDVKGILKKVSSYGGPIHKGRVGSATTSMAVGGRKVVTRSMSANAILRDSLEVTKHRHHQETPTKQGKKSVRFADLTYSDESDSEEQAQARGVTTGTDQKPPRPASARPATRIVRTSSKIPRVASAGTVRRGPFLRPHPPTHPPSGRAAMNGARFIPKPEDSDYQNKAKVTQHGSQGRIIIEPQASSEPPKAVFDVNGVRLDRTPTDDEINYLWDNVRTCLSKQSLTGSVSGQSEQAPPGKQAGTVSQKYIDGNSIEPQLRVATRTNNTYANNFMGTNAVANSNQARKKVSMDILNSYTKRAGLLNQRNRQVTSSTATVVTPPTVTTTTHSLHDMSYTKPIHSQTGPAQGLPQYSVTGQDVTESMAAFLTAENMAQKSASESEIEVAMEAAQHRQHAINTAHPQQKPISALSIEEQRLVQSLERLNERLRLTETNMYPSTSAVPNPPAVPKEVYTRPDCTQTTYTAQQCTSFGGFKGRQPISSAGRRQVNSNGTVPRHQYRGINSAGQVAHNSQLRLR